MRVTTTLLSGLLLLLSIHLPVSAQIKCWLNREGVRECGDKIPPEYSQQGHDVLNERGMIVDRVAPAKTPEQIEREKEEMRRKEEERVRLEKQEADDRKLLQQFSSLEDIENLRKAQLNAIDAGIESIQSTINSLDRNLKAMEKGLTDPNVKEPQRQEIERNIASMNKRIKDTYATLENQQSKKGDINAEYDGYAKRFSEIMARREAAGVKAPASPDSPPTATDNANPKK